MKDLLHTRLKPDGSRLPATSCPVCGKHIDACENFAAPSERPAPGDNAICGGCASFLVFEPDYTLRLMSDAEVAALQDDARIALLRLRRMIESLDALGPGG